MAVQSKLTIKSRVGIPLQWREVYWSGGTEIDSALSQWTQVAGGNSLLGLRAAFLSNSANITALSVTAFNPPAAKITRVVKLFPPMGGREGPADYCGLGVSLQFVSQGKRRSLSLRGIPDNWVEGNDFSDEGFAGVAKIISGTQAGLGKPAGRQPGYVQALIDRLGMGMYALNVPENYPFTAVSKTGAGLISLAVAPETGAIMSVGSIITVTQVPSMPLLKGPWKVASKADDNTSVQLAGSQPLAAIAGTTGRIRPAGRAIFNENIQTSVVGLRTRDTGHPTDGPRGRRSAKLRRR